MENESWLDKYKPAKLKDIIGNVKVIHNIDTYMKSIYEGREEKHIILLTGPIGVGKSLIANLVLQKYKYRIIEINLSTMKTELASVLNKTIHYKNVLELFMGDNRKTALIIEELESMCAIGAKSNITELVDIVKKSEKKKPEEKDKIRIPIILTAIHSSEKKIITLRGLSKEFVLSPPSKLNIKKILDVIIEKEKILIDPVVYTNLIINSGRDVRRAIIMLYDVHIGIKCNIPHTIDIGIKDSDIKINESINDVFTKTMSYEMLENIYYNEPFLVPLMIHENYINILLQPEYKNKKQNKLDTIIRCSKDLIFADMYNSDIIMNQYYDIQKYIPYYSNIPINREFMKYKTKIEVNEIHFSGLFNKLSQKTNKKIKVVSLLLNINRPQLDYSDIETFILMSVYYTYKYKNYKYLKYLMDYYGITFPQYEQIIKFYTRTGFNVKLRKELMELLSGDDL